MLKHFPFCTFSWHHSSYEHGMSVDYQHQYLFLSISNLVTGEKKTGALTKRLQAQPVNSNLLKTFFFLPWFLGVFNSSKVSQNVLWVVWFLSSSFCMGSWVRPQKCNMFTTVLSLSVLYSVLLFTPFFELRWRLRLLPSIVLNLVFM